MWQSPNNDNPWRPFWCPPEHLCRFTDSEHNPRNQQTIGKLPFCGAADDNMSKNYIDCGETEEVLYNHHNGNANANISDKLLFYGLGNVSTCDKQTQTSFELEYPLKQEPDHRLAPKKIVCSKSCDSLVRTSTVKPRASRSFDIFNQACKDQFDNLQTKFTSDNCELLLKNMKMSEEISPIRRTGKSNFPNDQSMTGGFCVRRYSDSSPSEHEVMSQNELTYDKFSEIPNHVEQIHIKSSPDEEFYSDSEVTHRNMPYRDKTENHYRNQWSPFHRELESDPMFYDYRQPDEISLISERSCYSTTSDEAENDYEIIDWSQYTEDYDEEKKDAKRKSDAFNTPPTTPVIDLSALDGYYTAPNSPNELESSNPEENNYRNFCVKYASSDCSNNYRRSDEEHSTEVIEIRKAKNDLIGHDALNNAQFDQNLCCQYVKSAEHGEGKVQMERERNRNEENRRKPQHEQFRQNKKANVSDTRILRLETPPFISVNSLHYEADPETGRAKVIGRGSFGQVYKARFSDPMFCHLPIVIKEFNEEFTNSKEIIEEAKRLHYLQDTEYVPICYGLLCFGSPVQPKYGIVQEYVGTGLTLEQLLWDQYELPLEFWFHIVIQCCEGLARFHEKGILLNDIKTNNILLEFADHSVRIRYIDFGLATDMRGKKYKNTKSLEDFVYLAPEVRRNGRITNIASDIYSLGYILEQIKKYTGVHELTVVAHLCMDRDPDLRIPPRAAASLIKDHMVKMGYDPIISWDM